MKRVACPKCGNFITFDESAYPANRILVFVCPACSKQFKVRCNTSTQKQNEPTVYGRLIVIENTFHHRQVLPLHLGKNIIGRFVKGTQANLPIETTDPSIDTTHCIVHVKEDKAGKLRFILRDAPSNTGTFYQDQILKDADRINMEEGSIITIGATSLIFTQKEENEEWKN